MQRKPLAGNIGWLRLRISIDSSLVGKQLYFNVDQAGASELYLDGRLLRRFGSVSANASRQVDYSPTRFEWYPLTTKPGPHVLAVRWAYHKPAWYVPIDRVTNQSMFEVTLRPADTLMEQVALPKAQNFRSPLIVGVFLMLSAVQFLYYLYRRQRVNLYFGLTSLFFALARSNAIIRPFQTDLITASWLAFVSGLCYMLYCIYLCATFYVFLNKRLTWLFWALTAVVLFAFFVDHFTEQEIIPIILLMAGLGGLFIDLLVASVTALRTQQANARLVLIPLLTMVGVMVGMIIVTIILRDRNSVTMELIGNAATLIINLTIPLTLAVILARENAQTNRDLEARLKDVEKLSVEKETILKDQKATLEKEVAQRTATLNRSLQELRNTQTQLVQREKMASLGELTAGIAHEIQNPLNFVNNFAEVSGELIAELRQEQTRPDRDPTLEAELLTDIEQNVVKIGQHGGRAASIVRGMLEHARTSTGERQPTDINALADEYMRLSYHGLRAKDKRFNATLVTEFTPSLAPISVVSQDIGRVLLNLFNNAFYAVQEKAKTTPEGYKPTVTVSTRLVSTPPTEPSNRPEGAPSSARSTGPGPENGGPGNGHVEVRVNDNGNGIPQHLQRKIFQPFFTTKPTGEGTGLGLSLSFDIVTKGHGGSLSVDTKPGEYTTFILMLPA
ncbi:histidine kinase [Fibrella sp. HMF5335]|uniref:histidine kinase n=2 Tax=Fibrella rubiginis TaxID=2817060 RepID=A0A939K4Q1_9BACT|nr:histidine kinase [Fibrella rubiginis]